MPAKDVLLLLCLLSVCQLWPRTCGAPGHVTEAARAAMNTEEPPQSPFPSPSPGTARGEEELAEEEEGEREEGNLGAPSDDSAQIAKNTEARPSPSPSPSPGTAQAAEEAEDLGHGDRGEEEAEDEEEEEDLGPLSDRSAQIIREQDAEEGLEWGEEGEETVWSPTSETTKDNANAHSLCEKPQPPENGYLKGSDYDDGGVVRIFCEEGFALHGPHKITCVPTSYPGAPGVWLPKDEYRCLPTELPNVVEIRTLDGNHIDEGPSYSVYNIDEHGYDTDKTHKRRGWQKKSTVSSANAKCPKPSDPQHGRLQGTDYSLYATVRVTCDEGYSLIGPDHITCLPVPDSLKMAGTWVPRHLPSCHAPPASTLPMHVLVKELGKERDRHHYYHLHHLRHRHHPNAVSGAQPPAPRHMEGLQTLCSLPRVLGPCRAAIPRFYFDTGLMECRPFSYGGCQGNNNNFHTFLECQSACR